MLNLPSCMGTCMKKSIWNNLLVIQTDSSLVCRLKKSLYGLKQSPRAWYAKMDRFLLDIAFSRCHSDNTVYTKKVVLQSKEGISLSQSKYSCDLLRHFHMEDCKSTPSPFQSRAKLSATCTSPEVDATLYRHLVGKLFYLTHTRPDLSFVVGLVTQFIVEASPLLVSFIDSDWAGDPNDRKYTVSYVFTLGFGPTWAYKKQSVISLSSAEEEYRGAIEASEEALWLRQILSNFGFQLQHPTTLWCDNQSVVQLCKDPVQHQHSKHIELHMHFIRKLIHDHVLEVKYCSTDDQVANIFKKALTEAKFTKLQFMVGV
eukprot:PITA_09715